MGCYSRRASHCSRKVVAQDDLTRVILHDALPRLVCVDEKLHHTTQYYTDPNHSLYESFWDTLRCLAYLE